MHAALSDGDAAPVQQTAAPTRSFRGPVRWLLGRDLLGTVKKTVFSTLLGAQVDLRDWMHGSLEDLTQLPLEDGAFWFDYIADSGDGQRATYSIAYLCLSDLWMKETTCAFDDPGGNATHLPRGAFLFVGGDTSYHVADYNTLVERLQKPFNWAADDKWGSDHPPDRRPIYGIPGNHDYYDLLNGFGRQFRKPFHPNPEWPRFTRGPQLRLDGFKRAQDGTFVALKLPFEWWLWGLDIEGGKIDGRQFYFFRSLRDQEQPRKLIVATPEPITVCGRSQDADSPISKTFGELVLPRPFLGNGEEIPSSSCRLDLSGDTHHYARYWGSGENDHGPTQSNYASVVSGLGGAFVHPTYTDFGKITPNRLYPAKEDTQRIVLQRMLNPKGIAQSGGVWFFAGLIAMAVYFGAVVSVSTRSVVEGLLSDPAAKLPEAVSENLWRIPEALDTDLGSAFRWYPELLAVGLCIAGIFIAGFGTLAVCRRAIGAKKATRAVWAFLVPPVFLIAFCAFLTRHAQQDTYGMFHPALTTLLLVLFLATSAACIHLMGKHTDALYAMAQLGREANRWDSMPWLALLVTSIGSAAVGILRYGHYPLAVVFSNLLFFLAVTLLTFGLLFVAILVGGEQTPGMGKVKFLPLGMWHALLQLAFPFLLAAYVPYAAGALAMAATVIITWVIGSLVATQVHPGKWLAPTKRLGWVTLALWALVVASLYASLRLDFAHPQPATVYRVLWAGVLGAVFGCTWFGWYLAVASFFNGHNNEVAGAAGIEEFKQFIRFRLTDKDLTGYVIAVDKPAEQGRCLKPYIIDVFTIRCA